MDFLVAERAITENYRSRLRAWCYGEFSVHNRVRVTAEDADGRIKLAGYMLRASGVGSSECPVLAESGLY